MCLAFAATGMLEVFAGTGQIANTAVCSVLSFIGIVVVAVWRHKNRPSRAERAEDDPDFGQTVSIIGRNAQGGWDVHYRGAVWQAQWENDNPGPPAGTAVIAGRSGNTLIIRAAQPDTAA